MSARTVSDATSYSSVIVEMIIATLVLPSHSSHTRGPTPSRYPPAFGWGWLSKRLMSEFEECACIEC